MIERVVRVNVSGLIENRSLWAPDNDARAEGNQIDVSPDGRYIVFQSQQVLQENIGIIDNVQ